MTRPGPGHNNGPDLEAGRGWRTYAWKRARAGLMGNKVPLEIVRIRVKRARALGLSYPQYASALMGGGRDIVGFLFTVDGLQLRLARELAVPDHVQDRLTSLTDTRLAAFAPSGEDPALFLSELGAVTGAPFDASAPEPSGRGWSVTRNAIRDVLAPLKVSGRSIILVGAHDHEAAWITAGKLAKFVHTSDYFVQSRPA